ncbi:MAG: biotin-dependent carboxyltransferase family protein [Pseudohongiella sp.]|nr:biotin-dependent carboxyltransferase family protein [Pseudohongiella sp.]MDP2126951.1 biotin-dependent carboxyltransferase family protein [Pseudohongiella sp.]
MMEVLLSAPMLTIQDNGRQGWRHLGVPRCGMMDKLALCQANLLLGNDENAAALEITSGPVLLKFNQNSLIVVMGADMQTCILDGDQNTVKRKNLIPGFIYALQAGDCLRMSQAAQPGQRAMLMVAGGFDVEPVMGSRSTDLMNGFGGLHGQALRAGDKVPIGAAPAGTMSEAIKTANLPHKSGVRQHSWNHELRIMPGTDYSRFDDKARKYLCESRWTLSPDCNRMGLRLQGEALNLARTPEKNTTRHLSIGVLPGLIQVPPDGQPIILAADAQTTGGYPAIASIISCDLWQLAYMTPGTRIRFSEVSLAEAHGLASHQQQQIQKLRDSLKLQRSRS